MTAIFGSLRLSDTDRVYNATVGQRMIYDAIADHLAMHNAALNAAMAMFVEETTENHTERFQLPGGGRLQRRGSQSDVAAVKQTGYWDVAFPLDDFGDAIAGDDVTLAYMTVRDLEKHVQTVLTRDTNTVRHELLRAMFRSTAATHVDPLWGSLTIRPLANGDGTLYPPVIGSDTEADDTHLVNTGYTAANISDTNDPIANVAIPELEEHFGQITGNSPIAVFINAAQVAKVSALTAMIEVTDRWVRPGDDTATPTGLPPIPGKILGRHSAGAWVSQWDYIPSGYMLAVHLDAPKPLKMRVDPADTGLAQGLTLVARDMEFPFERSTWRHRFGFGVANRLNGVAIEVSADGTYTTPTAYA